MHFGHKKSNRYVSQTKRFLQTELYILWSSAPVNLKAKFASETLFFICAAVQTSLLIWKSNIIYSEGELTFVIHISEM